MILNYENKQSSKLKKEIDELEHQRKMIRQGVGIDVVNKKSLPVVESRTHKNYSLADVFEKTPSKNSLKPRKQRVSKLSAMSNEIFQEYKNQLIEREIKKGNNLLSALENKYKKMKPS